VSFRNRRLRLYTAAPAPTPSAQWEQAPRQTTTKAWQVQPNSSFISGAGFFPYLTVSSEVSLGCP
jgi:hypothetical protein